MSSQKFHAFIALILIILVAAGVIALVSSGSDEPEPSPTPEQTQAVTPHVATPEPTPTQTPVPTPEHVEPQPEESAAPQETLLASGEFASDTGTKLNIKVAWSVYELANGRHEMRIRLYAVSYALGVGPRNGSISVLGEVTNFRSETIDYSGDDISEQLIYEMSVDVPKDASEIAVSANWDFDGVYSGNDIETIEASALIKL